MFDEMINKIIGRYGHESEITIKFCDTAEEIEELLLRNDSNASIFIKHLEKVYDSIK